MLPRPGRGCRVLDVEAKPVTRREEAVEAYAAACKSFGLPPFALVGYKAPMFEDVPMTTDMVNEVRTCLHKNARK
jgi:hypothetical protein